MSKRRDRIGGYSYMVCYPIGGPKKVRTLAITRGGWMSKARARSAFARSEKKTWRDCYRDGARVIFVETKEV